MECGAHALNLLASSLSLLLYIIRPSRKSATGSRPDHRRSPLYTFMILMTQLRLLHNRWSCVRCTYCPVLLLAIIVVAMLLSALYMSTTVEFAILPESTRYVYERTEECNVKCQAVWT